MKNNLLLLMSLAVVLGLVSQSCEEINGQEEDTPNPPENGIEFVDLGLTVDWATCNLGASSPDGCGEYYAWGMTTRNGSWTWNTYKHCLGTARSLTKYNQDPFYAKDTSYLDEYTVLQNEDDAAWSQSGGQWRMPTDAEWEELLANCSLSWDSDKKGYKITSKTNSNSIFLPAVGYYDTTLGQTKVLCNGTSACYWSSSLDTGDPRQALCVLTDKNGSLSLTNFYRYYGLSVRPVKSK